MGTTAGDKILEIDYPLAFGNAVSTNLEKTFRYVHLSGATTERDQEKPLWFKAEMRKMKVRNGAEVLLAALLNRFKGQAEENMLGFASRKETKGLWETLIVKSGFVISKDVKSPRDFMGWMMGTKACLRVNELAATMIDAALNGWQENTLQDVQAMGARGREVLGRS
jgi:hypothetical protein